MISTWKQGLAVFFWAPGGRWRNGGARLAPCFTQSPWERFQPGGLISLARFQNLATEAAPANAGYPNIARIEASSGRSTMPFSVTIASISAAGVTSNTGFHEIGRAHV